MNTPISKPRNPIYRVQAPEPNQVIIDSIMEHIQQQAKANRYINQQRAMESVTPSTLTDPLLNLKVRDYYSRITERNIFTEMQGRAFGAAEGALLGAGLSYGVAGIIELGGLVLAPITGGASLAATTPIAATIASTAAPIAASIGAVGGALMSDYTTYGATIGLLNDTIIKSFKQGVGYGTIKTLGVIGKTTDLIEGGEAIRATLAASINGEDISQAILDAYGLNTETGRTVYDFEKVREAIGIDVGEFGNSMIDLMGDLVTDPGFIASVGKSVSKKITESKIYERAIKGIEKTNGVLGKHFTNANLKNDKVIKQLSKCLMDNDPTEFARILTSNSSKYTDEQLAFVNKYFNRIRKVGVKSAASKVYDVFKSIDDFDDSVVRWGNRLLNPAIGGITLINKGIPKLSTLPIVSNNEKLNKFFDDLLGNGRYKTLTSALYGNIKEYKIKKAIYGIEQTIYNGDGYEELKNIFTEEELKNINIKNIYSLKKALYENPNDETLVKARDKIIKYYTDQKSVIEKELEDAVNVLKNTKEGTDDYIDKLNTVANKYTELVQQEARLKHITSSYQYSRAGYLFNQLRTIVSYIKKTKTEGQVLDKFTDSIQNIFNELLELSKDSPDEIAEVMANNRASMLISYVKQYINEAFTNDLNEWFGEHAKEYEESILKLNQPYRTQFFKEILDGLTDEQKMKIRELYVDQDVLKSVNESNEILKKQKYKLEDRLANNKNNDKVVSGIKERIKQIDEDIKSNIDKYRDKYNNTVLDINPKEVTEQQVNELLSKIKQIDDPVDIAFSDVVNDLEKNIKDTQSKFLSINTITKTLSDGDLGNDVIDNIINKDVVTSSDIELSKKAIQDAIMETIQLELELGNATELDGYVAKQEIDDLIFRIQEHRKILYSVSEMSGKTYAVMKNVNQSFISLNHSAIKYLNSVYHFTSTNMETLTEVQFFNRIFADFFDIDKSTPDKLVVKNNIDKSLTQIFNKNINTPEDLRKVTDSLYTKLKYPEEFGKRIRQMYNETFLKKLDESLKASFDNKIITNVEYNNYKKLINDLQKIIKQYNEYVTIFYSGDKDVIKKFNKEIKNLTKDIDDIQQLQMSLAIKSVKKSKENVVDILESKIRELENLIVGMQDTETGKLRQKLDILSLFKNINDNDLLTINRPDSKFINGIHIGIKDHKIVLYNKNIGTGYKVLPFNETNLHELASTVEGRNELRKFIRDIYDYAVEDVEALNTSLNSIKKGMLSFNNISEFYKSIGFNKDMFSSENLMDSYLSNVKIKLLDYIYNLFNGKQNHSALINLEKYINGIENSCTTKFQKAYLNKIKTVIKDLTYTNKSIYTQDYLLNLYTEANNFFIDITKQHYSEKTFRNIGIDITNLDGVSDKLKNTIEKLKNGGTNNIVNGLRNLKGTSDWFEESDKSTDLYKQIANYIKYNGSKDEVDLIIDNIIGDDVVKDYTMNLFSNGKQSKYNCFTNLGSTNNSALYKINDKGEYEYKNLDECTFVFVDTETTGHAKDDGLLSASYRIVKYDKNTGSFVTVDHNSFYISEKAFNDKVANNGWNITEGVEVLNKHNTKKELFSHNGTMTPEEIRQEILNVTKQNNAIMVAHNSKFDFGILNGQDNMFTDIPTLDTLSLYKMLNLNEFGFEMNEYTRFKNSDLGSVFKGINYTEYMDSYVDDSGKLVYGQQYNFRRSTNKNNKYTLEKHTYKDGEIEYRLKNINDVESRALHDADVDTELSTILFSNVLDNLNKNDAYKNVSKLTDLVGSNDTIILDNLNKRDISYKELVYNAYRKARDLTSEINQDLGNENLRYVTDKTDNIYNRTPVNYDGDTPSFVSTLAAEHIENPYAVEIIHNELLLYGLSSPDNINSIEDIINILEIVEKNECTDSLRELGNICREALKAYKRNKEVYDKLINGANTFTRQYNRNYVNLNLIRLYRHSDGLNILKSILKGDTEAFQQGSAGELFSLVFKNHNLAQDKNIVSLINKFDAIDRGIEFYTNVLNSDIVKDNPEMIDKFENMISFCEINYNLDKDINLLEKKFNTKFVYTGKPEDYANHLKLKNIIFDYIRTVPDGERLIVQPTTIFQNELYTDIENTIGSAIKGLANSSNNLDVNFNTYMKSLDDYLLGRDGIVRGSLNELRSYLSSIKKENRLMSLDSLPVQLIQNGIEDPFNEGKMLRPYELVKLNSKYVIKYAEDSDYGKKGASLKRLGNKVVDMFGLFKEIDNSDPNEFYLASQKDTTIGRLWNRLSNVFNIETSLMLSNCAAYKVDYTDYIAEIEPVLYNEKLFSQLFPNISKEQFKEIQQFLLELNSLNEASLGYITDVQAFKNMYKAYLIDGLVNKYSVISGYEDVVKQNKGNHFNKFSRMYTRFRESANQFSEFKKSFNSPEDMVEYLNKHKEHSLVYFDYNQNKFINLAPNVANCTYALNDSDNAFSLISRDTYYKMTKEFNPNKLPNPRILRYINELGEEVEEDFDPENDDQIKLINDIKNTEGRRYDIIDKRGIDNFINKSKEMFLVPLKVLSLTYSLPFIVQNALTAAMQNMRQYEGPMNVFKFLKDASNTNKRYQRHKKLEETLLNNASFIKFATGKEGNFAKLIQKDSIIDDMLAEGVDQDIIDYVKKLKNELTPEELEDISYINELLRSNAVRGEISQIESEMMVGKAKRRDYDSLNATDKYIYNTNATSGFNTIEDELEALELKDQRTLLPKERQRANELRRIINNKKYAFYGVINNRFTKGFMDVNEDLERVVRLQMIIDLMEQGYTKEASLSKVIDTHFVYDNKTVAEQYAEFIVPFISYPIRAANQLDELIGDYDFIKMMYLWDQENWKHKNSEKSDYLTKRRAKGDIPVGNKLLQLGNPLMETMTNVTNPLYALNNKLNPVLKPLVDVATNAEHNRWSQLPGISQAKAMYDTIANRNPLDQFTTDFYKSSGYINYYLPRMHSKNPKFYASLYTRTGYSRVAMNMSNTTNNNLYHRVNSILNYNGPRR